MASHAVLSVEDFSCPVCLKIFEDPVVLSCSHSFCNTCLQNWWRENLMRECPLCKKRSSKSRPPRNLVLKNLCEAFSQQRASERSLEVCSLHAEKLQLFCLDHQQPVCLVCRDSEQHTNHSFRPVDEAAQRHKAEIQKSLEPLKEKLKVLQIAKGDWVQTAEQLKVQVQETERQINEEFEKLQTVLQEEREARICVLKEEEKTKNETMREKIEGLTREIEDVSDSIRAVEKQLEAPDVSFLQDYKATVEKAKRSLPQEPQWPSGALTDVTRPLGTLKITYLVEEIQQILISARITCVDPTVDPTVAPKRVAAKRVAAKRVRAKRVAPTVDPSMDPRVKHTRLDPATGTFSAMRKYACKLTLDLNTVNNYLTLSEDNRKVTYGEDQSYPDHPDRFTFYPQVLCREGLTGRCYWEVEWRGWVVIGVTFRGIGRRGGRYDTCLGRNIKSWALYCNDKGYTARHNNIDTPICGSSVCNRVGVYVDWPAGSLSFYTVSSDTLTHLHTFYCTFTKPLIPAFWGSVSLCQIE